MVSAQAEGNGSSRSEPIRVRASVVSNAPDGEVNRRIVFEVGAWPRWQPGQFVMLAPGAEASAPRYDPLLPRPMAIFSSDGDGEDQRITVLYKVEGRGTRLLASAAPGEHVRVVGPLGHGFGVPPEGHHAVLVGGGTGTASLFALARDAAARGPVTVILGARQADLLMAEEDFCKLGVDLQIATEDGSRGTRGLVTDVLRQVLAAASAESAGAIVYACGPTAMMRACSELAAKVSVPCRVALENRMACGCGACLGCAVPMACGGFSLVCSQGPVYDASELDWAGIP